MRGAVEKAGVLVRGQAELLGFMFIGLGFISSMLPSVSRVPQLSKTWRCPEAVPSTAEWWELWGGRTGSGHLLLPCHVLQPSSNCGAVCVT